MKPPRSALIGFALLSMNGCALMLKSEPVSLRFYSPHLIAADSEQPGARGTASTVEGSVRLRLGEVEAASHLEQHIAYRDSEGELAYYQALRWTETPDDYLRQALSEEFFDRRGVRRVLNGSAPTLDVELHSFEELRFGKPRARIAFRFVLRTDEHALAEDTIQVEQLIEGPAQDDAKHAAQVTEALSVALRNAVAQAADRVLQALAAESHSIEPATVRQSDPRQSATPLLDAQIP
jgi:uncharacterized lipoprotein YmbA